MSTATLERILKSPDLHKQFRALPAAQQIAFAWRAKWLSSQALPHQLEPTGDWWAVWLLLAGRGAGKQLCVDTPIPTPTGWVRNGDLQEGDTVFDECGRPCRVVQAHPITLPERAYRVHFGDGTYLDADARHLWATLSHQARKQLTRHGHARLPHDWATLRHPLLDSHYNVVGYCGAEVEDTEALRTTLTHGSRQDLNHCIPLTRPLQTPPVQLPIDPYLLGCWLGDGSSKEQVIWGHVDDIDGIEAHARSLGYETSRRHDKGNTWGVRILKLSTQLRALGVFGCKHVPALYLRAEVTQRLALLRGLMDTDGYANAKLVEFCNTNKQLAEAVMELARSLGEKPVLKEGRAKLYGRDCGPKYRVTWRWRLFNPFAMPRKANKLGAPAAQGFKHDHRMITAIEPIEPKPMRCITVDSPSRLYLAGEGMIPTHNTRSAAENVAWWAWEQPKTRWLVGAPTGSDLRGVCFEGESGLINVIPKELIADYNKSRLELRLINGSLLFGIPASEPERFRGPQAHGGWLDELAAWEYLRDAWDMIQFGIRLGKRTKLICSTTPKPKEVVLELLGREGDDVVVSRASTYSNIDNLSPTFKKQILQYEGTKLGRQEIHAEIIDPEEGGIVDRAWFRLWPAERPLPKLEFIIQSYDGAWTDKTQNDPTGCMTFGVFKPLDGGMCVLILDCWQEWMKYPQLRQRAKDDYELAYGPEKKGKRVDLLLIEDKSSGTALIQDLQEAHLPVVAYNPGRADKTQRLSIVANIIKAGRVWVPESTTRPGYMRDWAEGPITQICSAADAREHDEFIDCISQALRYLRDAGWISIDPPPREDESDILDAAEYNGQDKVNPYAV
jgi:phage terminase large subunit-like protein